MRTNRAGMLLGVLSVFPVGALQAAEPCEPWVAKIVSIEGRVEASHIGEPRWVPARLKQTFCPGDRVRIESRSRAAVLLPNQTVLRLDEGTALTFTQVKPAEPSLLDLLKGAIHFLSRTPAQLRINTPFVAAGVEGTEFVLGVAEGETRLWVFEGRVRFANAKGSLLLASGEAAAAQADRAPQRRVVVRPREAVQWALYYPPLIDYRLAAYPRAAPGIREALAHYRRDNLSAAFESLDSVPEEARDASYYALTAGLLLNVGRVDEARADLDQALKLDPKNATAYALQSVIAMVQNEQEQALYLARKAEELDPQSPIPKVALSYAYQTKFDIEKALQNIEQAIALAPTDALAYARLAELQLSRGHLDRAVHAAKTAVALDPDLARTHAVLGFAYLTEIDIDRAKASFQKAIELDPASPLPRLGLGLAKIRDGDLREGTQEIEIAASLDPNNSLVRSYLGKAYFEEKRGGLASSEFEIAKQLDPNDPTPWFYDAIYKQTTNRPVEALHDLQKAIELNDNRAVYRSRLLLDEDRGGRNASLARIYDDLGFEHPALVEATKSLSFDPSSHSAHRFLSDAYARAPRHEVARLSELLQSQLLQPLNIDSTQPRLQFSDLNIVPGINPAEATFNEFTSLYERNRVRLLASGFGGNQGTWGDEVLLTGLYRNLSLSLGQFHSDTDGFRKNNDIENDLYNVFAQVALTPKLNVQAEYRRRETDQGDINLNFDPDNFSTSERRETEQDIGRLGARYSFAPHSDLLTSFIYGTRDIINADIFQDPIFDPVGTSFTQGNHAQGYQVEAQYLFRADPLNLIVGGYTYDIAVTQSFVFGDFAFPEQDFSRQQDSIYLYNNIHWPRAFVWTAGFSYDSYEQQEVEVVDAVHPKLGLQWQVTDDTDFRVAYLETVRRSGVVDQTMEPTQVAGFNQVFDDFRGTQAKRYGAGIDTWLSDRLQVGVEASRRELTVPNLIIEPSRSAILNETWREDLFDVYLHWTPLSNWSASAGYRFEKFILEKRIPSDTVRPSRVELMSVPFGLRYFNSSGAFAEFGISYVRQEVELAPLSSFAI